MVENFNRCITKGEKFFLYDEFPGGGGGGRGKRGEGASCHINDRYNIFLINCTHLEKD